MTRRKQRSDHGLRSRQPARVRFLGARGHGRRGHAGLRSTRQEAVRRRRAPAEGRASVRREVIRSAAADCRAFMRTALKASREAAWTIAGAGYSKQNFQKEFRFPKSTAAAPSHPRMKKLIMVAAILVGAVTASPAGASVSISIGVPLPPPIMVRPPLPPGPPPVVVAPRVCPPPRVVVATCPPPPPPRYRHASMCEHRAHGRDYCWHHHHDRRGHGRYR